jgi:hypothetical protein
MIVGPLQTFQSARRASKNRTFPFTIARRSRFLLIPMYELQKYWIFGWADTVTDQTAQAELDKCKYYYEYLVYPLKLKLVSLSVQWNA